MDLDVGVDEEDLVDKVLCRTQNLRLVVAQFEQFGNDVGDGTFVEELDKQLFDGQRCGGVDEVVNVFAGYFGLQNGQFVQLVHTESQIVVQKLHQVLQGVVVDVQSDLLCFVLQQGDAVTDVGFEKAYPDAPFFVSVAALQALGVFGISRIGVEEVVVGIAVGQCDEGLKLLFGDLLVMLDDQQVGTAKEGALGEVPFCLFIVPLVKVKRQRLLFCIQLRFVALDIVVYHKVVVAEKENCFGESGSKALVEFALVHVKNLRFLKWGVEVCAA